MSEKLVAADASPIIGLATADALELLRKLFGTVTISRIVVDEVMAGGSLPGASELSAAMREGWIRVAPAPMETWKFAELGAGEASTIALALEHVGPSVVLMDDALGRAQAEALGLEVQDVPGVLVAAKRAQLVEHVRPILDRLARRGFTIPDEAVHSVLAETGEVRRSS